MLKRPKGWEHWATVDPLVSAKGCVVLCSPHKLWLQSSPDRFLAFAKLLISTKLAEVAELQLAGGLKNSLGETERQCSCLHPVSSGNTAKYGSSSLLQG